MLILVPKHFLPSDAPPPPTRPPIKIDLTRKSLNIDIIDNGYVSYEEKSRFLTKKTVKRQKKTFIKGAYTA